MKKRQLVGAAIGLCVVAGAAGFGLGRWGPSAVVRQTGQRDVLEAYALINQANQELSLGHHVSADAVVSEAAGYLFSAVTPLEALGITDASAMTTYLQGAEYDFVRGTATAHQRTVLRTFRQALAPFARDSFGDIPEPALRSALNRVASVMDH